MLYGIQQDKIRQLSLEMVIYYMFKDYPEIINAYNNEVIPQLRENNLENLISDLKDNLINVNADNIVNGNNPKDEIIFIESLIGMYNDFVKEKKSIESMRALADKIRLMKEEESNFNDNEKNHALQMVENINFF